MDNSIFMISCLHHNDGNLKRDRRGLLPSIIQTSIILNFPSALFIRSSKLLPAALSKSVNAFPPTRYPSRPRNQNDLQRRSGTNEQKFIFAFMLSLSFARPLCSPDHAELRQSSAEHVIRVRSFCISITKLHLFTYGSDDFNFNFGTRPGHTRLE